MKRKMRGFSVMAWLIAAFFAPWLTIQIAAAEDQLSATDVFYDSSDFYYIAKNGERVILKPDSKTIVVSIIDEIKEPAAKIKEAVVKKTAIKESDIGAIEKFEALFGTREVKSIIKKGVFYRVAFNSEVSIPAVVSAIISSESILSAYPVFYLDNELVFPAGVWVKTKHLNSDQQKNIMKKFYSTGYTLSWSSAPIDVDSRSLHYTRSSAKYDTNTINPLRLSRLMAQDLAVEWSVPDFVPVKSMISIELERSRVTGTMGETLLASYRITYDRKKIAPDWKKIENAQADDLMPEGLVKDVFKLNPITVRDDNGVAHIEISFRIYLVGQFLFMPANGAMSELPYNIVGASDKVPPLTTNFPTVTLKVIGLLPRNEAGRPLIADIFPWEKMPLPTVAVPEKPLLPSYPKTDLRYYSESILKRSPKLLAYLDWAIGILIIWPVAILFVFGCYKLINWRRNRVADQRDKKYRLSRRRFLNSSENGDSFASAVISELRRLLRLGEGVTEREIMKKALGRISHDAERIITLANEARSGTNPEVANKIASALRGLKAKLYLNRLLRRKSIGGGETP